MWKLHSLSLCKLRESSTRSQSSLDEQYNLKSKTQRDDYHALQPQKGTYNSNVRPYTKLSIECFRVGEQWEYHHTVYFPLDALSLKENYKSAYRKWSITK